MCIPFLPAASRRFHFFIYNGSQPGTFYAQGCCSLLASVRIPADTILIQLTVSLNFLVVLKDFLRDHNEVKLEVILCIVYVKSGVDADHI